MALIETMTPRERVMNALAGKPVDRTPVANPTSVATVELMDLIDAPFPDACRDPELNARLAATGHTELGFDSISPYFTIIQESSALGCEMQWEQKDNWPTVRMTRPIWKGPEDVHIPAGFLEHPDCIAITRSISTLKEEFGKEVAIIGKTMGPWTAAYHVFGVEPFLLMSIDDPDMTLRALHELKEISILFGQAQIDAGADVLTFPDHATGDLVSGDYYKRFLLEIHQEMAERLDVPLILHICGKTIDRMDYIAQSDMAMFHFDSKNDPQEAMDIMDGRIGLVGNINNPETLYARGPDEVRQEVYRCMDAGVGMIAPECAIPLSTRLENLLEIPRAVKDWTEEHQAAGAREDQST
jgi:MtaA/CmuA family methyltransferase